MCLLIANSEDPDEMLYNAAIHQGLCCLLRPKKILRRQYFPDIITRAPSNYTMNHPRITISNQKEEAIYKGLIFCCMYEISSVGAVIS